MFGSQRKQVYEGKSDICLPSDSLQPLQGDSTAIPGQTEYMIAPVSLGLPRDGLVVECVTRLLFSALPSYFSFNTTNIVVLFEMYADVVLGPGAEI